MTNEDPGYASILLAPNESEFATSLEEGTYTVRYSADGYVPVERTVTLDRDTTMMPVTLQPEQIVPETGTLRLTVSPTTVLRTVQITEAESEWCTVTYNMNGGDWAPDAERVAKGAIYQITSWRASGNRMFFEGWQDLDGNFYAAGDKITVTGDLVLNAQWLPFPASVPSGHPVLADVVAFDNYIVNGEGYQAWWDVNEDGEADIFDLVRFAQYIADH